MYSVLKYLFQPIISCLAAIITVCQVGCPIRKFLDQSFFSAPQDLSQSNTSFIASCCQGIHQTPFSRLIRSGKRQALESTLPQVTLVRATLFFRIRSILSRSDLWGPNLWSGV